MNADNRQLETPFLAEEYVRSRPQRFVDYKRWRCCVMAYLIFLLVSWFGFAGIIIGGLTSGRFPAWLSAATFVFAAQLMLVILLGDRFRPRSLKVEIEMWRRLAEVPESLRHRAQRLYGSDKDYPWMFSAIECHESHLPGDCPLCGAR